MSGLAVRPALRAKWTFGAHVHNHGDIVLRRGFALYVLFVLVGCGGGDDDQRGVCIAFLPDGTCAEYAMATDGGTAPVQPIPNAPHLPEDATPETVCASYRDFIEAESASPFVPGSSACDPGTLTDAAYAEALGAANYVRWLVGLRGLEMDPSVHASAQAAATMMANAGSLSHTPAPDWPCFTDDGARGARQSNLGLGSLSGRQAIGKNVARFFIDTGANNRLDVGHRRLLLSTRPRRVGFGYHESTAGGWYATAYNVYGGSAIDGEDRAYVAYPEGVFPLELLSARGMPVPWSVSFIGGIPNGAPTVELVRTDDDDRPVTIVDAWYSARLFGDGHAVVFEPASVLEPGRYRYVVRSGGRALAFDAELVDCTAGPD